MLNSLWLRNHHTICIIYSIEGRLICQIADLGPWAFSISTEALCTSVDIENTRGPRSAIWHINRPSMLNIICQVVVTLRLTITERTVSFRHVAILQFDMPYIKPQSAIIYQTCPSISKPPRGWGPRYLAYQPRFCTSYDISSACDVTARRLWRKLPSFSSSLATAILEVDMPYNKPAHNT